MKTDSQLQADVLAELRWEPSVRAAQIGVQVKDGVVTLAGEVSSLAEKWSAESAAQRVSGVTALAIDLDVKLGEFGRRSDSDIARSAQTALSWSTTVPRDTVNVMVEAGKVTLTGVVEWQFQKHAATDSVRHLSGVVSVSNEMVIEPTVPLSTVQTGIETALKRIGKAGSKNISVVVSGADITLSGTAASWAERDLATTAAWGTPGVRRVISNVTVVS